MQVRDHIAVRKQTELLKWRLREASKQALQSAGVDFTLAAEEGGGRGVAFIPHKAGRITFRLSSGQWNQGQLRGDSLKTLLEYLND